MSDKKRSVEEIMQETIDVQKKHYDELMQFTNKLLSDYRVLWEKVYGKR